MTAFRIFGLGLGLGLALCSACTDDAASTCVTGTSIRCACSDRELGAQVCLADGTFGACDCGSSYDAGITECARDAATPEDAGMCELTEVCIDGTMGPEGTCDMYELCEDGAWREATACPSFEDCWDAVRRPLGTCAPEPLLPGTEYVLRYDNGGESVSLAVPARVTRVSIEGTGGEGMIACTRYGTRSLACTCGHGDRHFIPIPPCEVPLVALPPAQGVVEENRVAYAAHPAMPTSTEALTVVCPRQTDYAAYTTAAADALARGGMMAGRAYVATGAASAEHRWFYEVR